MYIVQSDHIRGKCLWHSIPYIIKRQTLNCQCPRTVQKLSSSEVFVLSCNMCAKYIKRSKTQYLLDIAKGTLEPRHLVLKLWVLQSINKLWQIHTTTNPCQRSYNATTLISLVQTLNWLASSSIAAAHVQQRHPPTDQHNLRLSHISHVS